MAIAASVAAVHRKDQPEPVALWLDDAAVVRSRMTTQKPRWSMSSACSIRLGKGTKRTVELPMSVS